MIFIFRKLNFLYDYGSLVFFDIVVIFILFMVILFWIVKVLVYMEWFKRKICKRKVRVIYDWIYISYFMWCNSGDSYKGVNVLDGYVVIFDEVIWENYLYCNGVNCSCFRSDCNFVYFEKRFFCYYIFYISSDIILWCM